ncbi:PAS domain-containing protein [Xenorhabdus sp. PB62.4]|uniref:PAS domain-containing protein n=1 Tax=Xenorhabdus sp. PB62.4 TaxID=1851573 RepID=UPI001656A4EE|nr:PAS domain-containing protein [Xenorhabdus sp. PB62.4]MBC8951643.1 LuxR family transcriptional regulator [Xenorhabdus sp. PB62.4]
MKNSNNITPQLIHMWKKSIEPWGATDLQSRFIYANSAFYQLLDLPEDFDITGLNIGELPSPIAKYREEFYLQDQKVIQKMQRVTSMETHPFGKYKVKQSYLCDKYPLYDNSGGCIGIIFHMYKTQGFSISYYYDGVIPESPEFKPPSDKLEQIEWEILFLLLRSLDEKSISEELMINIHDVTNYMQSVYQKLNLSKHLELKKFCKEQKLDRYIPERFVTVGSRELN